MMWLSRMGSENVGPHQDEYFDECHWPESGAYINEIEVVIIRMPTTGEYRIVTSFDTNMFDIRCGTDLGGAKAMLILRAELGR